MRRPLALLTPLPLLLSFVALGCGADFSADDSVTDARAAEAPLVIVSLQFQDVTLRVHGDACFTLVEHDGTVLAAHVTREELDALAPEVAVRYDQMVAGYPIDASVDPELLAPSDPFAP